jgi:phage terminase small subunit
MSCGSLCRELWLSGLGAVALAYADEATAKVQALGMLVEVPHTRMPIQSPWIAIMNRQTEIARKLASELALPPAQRSRAGLTASRSAILPDDEWSI